MENILTVSGVTKSFGSLRAVDNASFSVKEREVHSLIGPQRCWQDHSFQLHYRSV